MLPVAPGVILEAEIGRGGFATVYRGRQQSVDRSVAVKLDSRQLTNPRDLRRFLREVHSAGRVSAHPNIVTVFDAGTTTAGQPYLVMEYCPGGSYADRMQTGPLPVGQALEVGAAIADGLQAAHELGILHRDIKPANILITQYGTPALADFGLATLPRADGQHSVTVAALTPAYAAPEAFDRGEPQAVADIYSLGATVYALIQGRSPRCEPDGSTPSLPQLLAQIHHELPAIPGLAPPVMQLLWKATHPDPAQRYQSAAAFRDALASVRRQLPDAPQPTMTAEAIRVAAEVEPAGIGAEPGRTDSVAARAGGTQPAGVPSRQPAARPTWPTGPTGPTAPAVSPGRRRVAVAVAAGLAGALVLIAALYLGRTPRISGQPATAAAPLSAAGQHTGAPTVIPTGSTPTLSNTPAPSAAPNTAVGTTSPPPATPGPGGQCFAGLVNISGVVTARKTDCATDHYWESFASGTLPPRGHRH